MIRPIALFALLILNVSTSGREPDWSGAQIGLPMAAEAAAIQRQSAAQRTRAVSPGEVQPATTEKRSDASNQGATMPLTNSRPAEGGWKAGTHYELLVPAQPTHIGPGKVEVVEFFWYACGQCYEVEPHLVSWHRTKPDYVEFTRVPVQWNSASLAHARLYYTLRALGREDLHQDVFDAIHQRGNKLFAEGDEGTFALQLEFAKAHGIAAEDFTRAYGSADTNSDLQRADQLTRSFRIEGVPAVAVNGRYLTDFGRAGGHSDLIALVRDLADSERPR